MVKPEKFHGLRMPTHALYAKLVWFNHCTKIEWVISAGYCTTGKL